MSISCGVCKRAVTALDGFRCRLCHALVCSSCLGEQDKQTGAVCLSCLGEKKSPGHTGSAESQPKAAKGEADTPVRGKTLKIFTFLPSLRLPPLPLRQLKEAVAEGWHRAISVWRWIVFVGILSVVFSAIVLWPAGRAKLLRREMSGEDNTVAERAVVRLRALGGRMVEREMVDELVNGRPSGRLRALKVLAEVGSEANLRYLQELKDNPSESPLIRDAAAEAWISIQEH